MLTKLAAEAGARVIKLEIPPGAPGGDDMIGGRDHNRADYENLHRNKESLTLNMKEPEGLAILRELVKTADVFIENYRPDVKYRLGIGPEELRRINPRLVYASISGFGQEGPYANWPGFDSIAQGMGGLMSVTGERDDLGGGPQKVGVAVADLFTGMYATVAILAALRHAERTGEGQMVDMALLDTQVAMLANLGSNYLVSGKTPGRAGNAHQNIVPYQVFEVMAPTGAAPGTRDHLILAVGNDGQFVKFCAVAGCPELAQDPRFAQNTQRVRHRDTLVPLLEGILKTRTKADWLAALEAAKVPCGAINTLSEVFVDPQIQARGMVQDWQHPVKPDLKLVASPIKMSRTPVRQDLPPPMLGQHTAEVLAEVLGWNAEQLGPLRGKGVI